MAFPIIVLQVAAGHLFAPAAALALNVLGLAVDLTVPFWIGRFSGLGASGTPCVVYLSAGLLGGLPSLLAATLLGASVSQPGSPAFWLALGITAGVSVLSLLGYLLWQKRQKNKI